MRAAAASLAAFPGPKQGADGKWNSRMLQIQAMFICDECSVRKPGHPCVLVSSQAGFSAVHPLVLSRPHGQVGCEVLEMLHYV